MDLVAISSLVPASPLPSNTAFRALVTLLWPYSSSTGQCALLLADPDARKRYQRGQVRVRFSGPSARCIAKSKVSIGDEVELELSGARWISESEDGGIVKTPGRGLEGELLFRGQLRLRIRRVGQKEQTVLQVDEDDEEEQVGVSHNSDAAGAAAPSTPASRPLRRSGVGVDGFGVAVYSSPAFMKRMRLSEGSFGQSPHTPVSEDDDLDTEASRKRRRVSYKNVTEWKVDNRSSSPEKPNADAQVANDNAEGLDGAEAKENMAQDSAVQVTGVESQQEGTVLDADTTMEEAVQDDGPELVDADTTTIEQGKTEEKIPEQISEQVTVNNETKGRPTTQDSEPELAQNGGNLDSEAGQSGMSGEIPTTEEAGAETTSEHVPNVTVEGTSSGNTMETNKHEKEHPHVHFPPSPVVAVETYETTVDATEIDPAHDAEPEDHPEPMEDQDRTMDSVEIHEDEDRPSDHPSADFEFVELNESDSEDEGIERVVGIPEKSMTPFSQAGTDNISVVEVEEGGEEDTTRAQSGGPLEEANQATKQSAVHTPEPPARVIFDTFRGMGHVPSPPVVVNDSEPAKPQDAAPAAATRDADANMTEAHSPSQGSEADVSSEDGYDEDVLVSLQASEGSDVEEDPDLARLVKQFGDDIDADDLRALMDDATSTEAEEIEELFLERSDDETEVEDDDSRVEDVEVEMWGQGDSVSGSDAEDSDAESFASQVEPIADAERRVSEAGRLDGTDDVDDSKPKSPQSIYQAFEVDESMPDEEAAWKARDAALSALGQPEPPGVAHTSAMPLSSFVREEHPHETVPPRKRSTITVEILSESEGDEDAKIEHGADAVPNKSAQDIQPIIEEPEEETLMQDRETRNPYLSVSPQPDDLTSQQDPDDGETEVMKDDKPDSSRLVSQELAEEGRSGVETMQESGREELTDAAGTKEPQDVEMRDHRPEQAASDPASVPGVPDPKQDAPVEVGHQIPDMPGNDTVATVLEPAANPVHPEQKDTPQLTSPSSMMPTEDSGLGQKHGEVKSEVLAADKQDESSNLEVRTNDENASASHSHHPTHKTKPGLQENDMPLSAPALGGKDEQQTTLANEGESEGNHVSHQPQDSVVPSLNTEVPKETHTEEPKTPVSNRRTSPRKSISKMSGVPAVISAWFSPRRASGAQTPSRGEKEAHTITRGPASAPPKTQAGPRKRSISPPRLGRFASRGLATPLSYFYPLAAVEDYLNQPSATIDIIAVSTAAPTPATKSKRGAKDFFTILHLLDPSLQAQNELNSDKNGKESTTMGDDMSAEIFRPWKACLPSAEPGDVVLLRDFHVRSRKRRTYLLSSDMSSWCVWRFSASASQDVDAQDIFKPAWERKKLSMVKEEMKGPPVDIGPEEREKARELRQWWEELQAEKKESPEQPGQNVEAAQDEEVAV